MNFKHIEVEQHGGATVMRITDSRINEYEQSHQLRDEIVNAIREAESRKVVLDMRHVEYLTSVALLPFVSVNQAANE